MSRADRRTFDGGVQFISANTVLRVPVKHTGLSSHCISQIHGPPFITRFMARHRAAATFAVETHPSWCAFSLLIKPALTRTSGEGILSAR